MSATRFRVEMGLFALVFALTSVLALHWSPSDGFLVVVAILAGCASLACVALGVFLPRLLVRWPE